MTEPVLKRSYCEITAPDALLQQFETYLRRTKKSSKTRAVYMAVIRRWSGHASSLTYPSSDDISAWVKARRMNVSINTLNVEFSALRAFYGWLSDTFQEPAHERIKQRFPASKRPPRRLLRTLDEWQVGQLLAAPDLNTPLGYRDHIIMRLVYETGITAAECVGLAIGDIMFEHRMIHIFNAETRRERFVPATRTMFLQLEHWLQVRRQFRTGKREILFVTRSGSPFSSQRALWDIVNRYAGNALGLARGFDRLASIGRRRPWQGHYPHLLRASFANHLIKNGCDLRAVQEMLGHADVRTTAAYVGVDINIMRQEHQKLFPPRLQD